MSRPRKPVAVMGRASGLDLAHAAIYQRQCQSWLLAKTPAESALLAMRVGITAELRKGDAVTAAAALGMIASYRARAADLRTAAAAEQAARATKLEAAAAKGDWIWTCRT